MIFVASGTQDGRGLVEYLLKQNYKVMASVVMVKSYYRKMKI